MWHACCSASLPNLVQLHELRQLLQHHVSLLRQQLRLLLPTVPMCYGRPVAVLGLSWLAGGVAGGRCRRRSRARDLLTDEPEHLRPAVVYGYIGANWRATCIVVVTDHVFTCKNRSLLLSLVTRCVLASASIALLSLSSSRLKTVPVSAHSSAAFHISIRTVPHCTVSYRIVPYRTVPYRSVPYCSPTDAKGRTTSVVTDQQVVKKT